MTVTTRHPASKHGRPVILDDAGRVMGQIPGLTVALCKLKWTRQELAARCGVSIHTVQAWFQEVDGAPRRTVPAESLNVLADALADRVTSGR
jgi:hypothetical protein